MTNNNLPTTTTITSRREVREACDQLLCAAFAIAMIVGVILFVASAISTTSQAGADVDIDAHAESTEIIEVEDVKTEK